MANGSVTTEAMLAAERAAVLQRWEQRQGPGFIGPPPPPAALCLSGGGIRSASFCLGVVQALAEAGRLGQFDYLSTVSGGGYIGGWLQRRMLTLGGTAALQAELAAREPSAALQRLRRFSNFLTPKTGLASADTWALVVLYVRNLLLNWVMFLPMFVALALAPVLLRTVLDLIRQPGWLPMAGVLSVLASVGVIGLAILHTCALLPGHRMPRAFAWARTVDRWAVRWLCVWLFAGTLAMLFTLPGHFEILPDPMTLSLPTPQEMAMGFEPTTAMLPLLLLPLVHFAMSVTAYEVARYRAVAATAHPDVPAMFARNRRAWWLAGLFGAAILLLALKLMSGIMLVSAPVAAFLADNKQFTSFLNVPTLLAVVGPLLMALVMVFQTGLFAGLRGGTASSNLDREWMARLNAKVLLVAACWTALAICCLVLGPLAIGLLGSASGAGASLAASWEQLLAGLGLPAVVGALLAQWGKQAVTEVRTRIARNWLQAAQDWGVLALAAVFSIALLAMLSALVQVLVGMLVQAAAAGAPDEAKQLYNVAAQALLGLSLWALLRFAEWPNINRFSMHAIYRNRLMRAFLGSARDSRRADRFTDFDPDDDLRLAKLHGDAGAAGLFPVINIALNATSSSNTAWAERMATSFTATPLHCGAAALAEGQGAFVPTAFYAGHEDRAAARAAGGAPAGASFGGFLTISGAAASPNIGYHSSPGVAFVMTLFNVRLGAWLPNPAQAEPLDLQVLRPRNSQQALLGDLLGQSSENGQAVYLSDGGHFENLGLYEMLRRHCGRIVVVDATGDPKTGFTDMAAALRKARIDLGVEVKIVLRPSDFAATDDAPGFVSGAILYPDGTAGQLLLIKPTLLPSAPPDVHEYRARAADFPHESTGDQWFSESQMESYRALGRHQMQQAIAAGALP